MMAGLPPAPFTRTVSETNLTGSKLRSSMKRPPSMSDRSMSALIHFNIVVCGGSKDKSSVVKAMSVQSVPGKDGPALVVELPALYGKPNDVVREESLKCMSRCEPEGRIHAFILVLPLEHLTDYDKKELETIQDTFGPAVNEFIMIIFTLDSNPTDRDHRLVKENGDAKDLYRKCGGRYVIVNSQSEQPLGEVFATVENMTANGSKCFTQGMFAQAQVDKITSLEAKLRGVTSGVRMALVGKTGGGKSATANTILGQDRFQPTINAKQKSKTCQEACGEVDGRPVKLVITPGLFKTTLSEKEIELELTKCLDMLAPGPHVFLLVLQIQSITPEEKHSIKMIRHIFGEQAQNHTIIVFTRGEELRGQSLESYLEDCDPFVKQLVSECGWRYVVFDNKDVTNRAQVRKLLSRTDSMVKQNGGDCYTRATSLTAGSLHRMKENANKEHEETKRMKKVLEKKILELEKRSKESGEKNTELKEQLQQLSDELERLKRKRAGCRIT